MLLIFMYGWLGLLLEFIKVIGLLIDLVVFGGCVEDVFDVVIFVIFGYGFFGKLIELGWNLDCVVRVWDVLMKWLGYM